jgi:hypothetical protein
MEKVSTTEASITVMTPLLESIEALETSSSTQFEIQESSLPSEDPAFVKKVDLSSKRVTDPELLLQNEYGELVSTSAVKSLPNTVRVY